MTQSHDELHQAMQAAAENYSMATYHVHFFVQEQPLPKRKAVAEIPA